MANISNFLFNNSKPNHEDIDFVNININQDTRLFLDPVLIDIGKSSFCIKAKTVIQDYFNCLYKAYADGNSDQKHILLQHAREINDSHLGYGVNYGRGHTEDGLYDVFQGIGSYITNVFKWKSYDFVLLTPNFAEDGMSDLLTNILYKELSDFTIEQCKKYGYPIKACTEDRFYWDAKGHQWLPYYGDSLIINDKPVLLVPKEVVQFRYRFTADNYLRSVIVENICESQATYDKQGHKDRPPKDKVRSDLIEENGSVFSTISKYSKNDPKLLLQYDKILKEKYQEMQLEDWQFDSLLYEE